MKNLFRKLRFKIDGKIGPLQPLLNRLLLAYFRTKFRLRIYKGSGMVGSVNIQTTTECNRRCAWCPVSNMPLGKSLMSVRLYKKIIDQLADIGFKGWVEPQLFGEPLLDKRLPYLVGYARQKLPESSIHIYTNGDLLSLELFEKLTTAGADLFFITLYSEDMPKALRETYNSIGRSGRERIVLRRRNENSYWSTVGGLVKPSKVTKKKICLMPSLSMNINCKGDVLLCCSDYLSSHKFGNISSESILTIWNKPAFKKVRSDIKNGIYYYNTCTKCSGGA